MSWKFWKKKGDSGSAAKAEKLSGPRELPAIVGRHLVVALKNDPDWAWQLKSVVRRRPDAKQVYDIRVFSESEAALKKVSVRDYNTLEDHSDLILFEGWFDNRNMDVHVNPKTSPQAA